TRFSRDWSSDVCSSDLGRPGVPAEARGREARANEGWYRETFAPFSGRRSFVCPRRLTRMAKGKYYITTPIYYPSDRLHIGHAYRSEERRVGKECTDRVG